MGPRAEDREIQIPLNINSLRNKFDSFIEILSSNVDIFLISETKIDSSFPTAQYKIGGYTTYKVRQKFKWRRYSSLCQRSHYVREDIPYTLLNTESFIEGFCIEIKIRKKKCFLVCTYNPNKNFISNNLKEIDKNLDS